MPPLVHKKNTERVYRQNPKWGGFLIRLLQAKLAKMKTTPPRSSCKFSQKGQNQCTENHNPGTENRSAKTMSKENFTKSRLLAHDKLQSDKQGMLQHL